MSTAQEISPIRHGSGNVITEQLDALPNSGTFILGVDATGKFQLLSGESLPAGPAGEQGIQGEPGPNMVSSSTSTDLTGILRGNGSTVLTVSIGNGLSFSSGTLSINDAVINQLILAYLLAAPTIEPVAPNVVWRDSGVVKVSAGIPPAITSQPTSVNVIEGNIASFLVAATNATSYQWRRNETAITGATSSSYSFTASLSHNGDSFSCVVTGPGGVTTSSSATLTVTANVPVITAQPQSVTINSGTTTTLSVTATNANGYQWQNNTGSGWSNVSGATSSSYTTVNLTYDAGNGYQYRCIVSKNAANVTSNAATVTVLLAGDRYLSPTGSDSANGQTRGTAWQSVDKLNTWLASLSSGTYKVVVLAGTYTGKGFLFSNNSSVTLTVEFEEGVTIDTSGQVTATDGISVTNNPTSTSVWNLRGANFTGNGVGSANGIDTNSAVNLVVNGDGATFSGYDDGLSLHGTSGTADKIVFNGLVISNCSKGAVVNLNSAIATHNRCEFIGKSGSSLGFGALGFAGNVFNDCIFTPTANRHPLSCVGVVMNRCKIGNLTHQVALNGTEAGTFTDCFIRADVAATGIANSTFTRCYGKLDIEMQGTSAAIGFTLQRCIFKNGAYLYRTGDFGHTKGAFRNCVLSSQLSGYPMGLNFSATQYNAWNADSFIQNCNTFGTTINSNINASVSGNQTSNPLLGPCNTMHQADWCVADNSPCVGAGTGGTNIGFTLADLP